VVLFVSKSLEPTKDKIKVKEHFDNPKYDASDSSFLNRKGREIDITDARISNQKENPDIEQSFPATVWMDNHFDENASICGHCIFCDFFFFLFLNLVT